MISDTRTSAPRSSVIHAVDGRTGISAHQTRCGRTIGERWAGEYDAQPAGDVTCARCIKGCASDQAELEERAAHKTGEQVGILVGFLAPAGPHVGTMGTVVSVVAHWNGAPAYIVQTDDSDVPALFEGWMLTTDPVAVERARLVREGIDQEVAQLASLLTGNPWTPRLVSRLTDEEILSHHREAERAAAMRRHPAGKARATGETYDEGVCDWDGAAGAVTRVDRGAVGTVFVCSSHRHNV